MRVSSPARHRRLPVRDDGQLMLPFLAEGEVAQPASVVSNVSESDVDHGVRSVVRRSRPERFSPPARTIEKATVSDRKPTRKAAKRKPPTKASIPADMKMLVGREQAAEMLSISIRGVDYMIATKQLSTRRIATRVLIPIEDVRKFARSDHPGRMADPLRRGKITKPSVEEAGDAATREQADAAQSVRHIRKQPQDEKGCEDRRYRKPTRAVECGVPREDSREYADSG